MVNIFRNAALEKILALLNSEGISFYETDRVLKCLEGCVTPTKLKELYLAERQASDQKFYPIKRTILSVELYCVERSDGYISHYCNSFDRALELCNAANS